MNSNSGDLSLDGFDGFSMSTGAGGATVSIVNVAFVYALLAVVFPNVSVARTDTVYFPSGGNVLAYFQVDVVPFGVHRGRGVEHDRVRRERRAVPVLAGGLLLHRDTDRRHAGRVGCGAADLRR